MKFQTTTILSAVLALTANAKPVHRRAVGDNVQTFTGALGGVAPPVTETGGDRPFTVNGATFVGQGNAIVRSCDIQNNACSSAFNSGSTEVKSLDECATQLTACKAAASAGSAATAAGNATEANTVSKASNNKAAANAAKAGKGEAATGAKNATADARSAGKAAAPAKGNAKANATAAATPAKGAAKGNSTGSAAGATAGTAAGGAVLPDGRIAQDAKPEDFNVLASKFKSAVVKGEGLVFSDIISFPAVDQSLFDVAGNTKAFEISINDSSIFAPQGGAPQADFRRADLLPSIASTLNNVSTTGKKAMHFSISQDGTKPLDLTHEYQLSFLETADFGSRSWDVRVGTGGTSPGLDGKNIVVLGRSGAAIKELFVTPFTAGFHNFAIDTDFDKNTIEVFHSTASDPLVSVAAAQANDNSGNGEYHFALLKLAKAGVQEAGINEGIVFGGIFMEDTSATAVTLS